MSRTPHGSGLRARRSFALLTVAAAVAGSAAILVVTASPADAAATPNLGTNSSAVMTVGIFDEAILSGGINPTGTISFDLFGPNDATCTGAPAFSSTVAVAGNGNYLSRAFMPHVPGIYRWVANYSGDADNNGAGPTACLDPTESVVFRLLTLSSTASPGVIVGGQIHDTATLADGIPPTPPGGTITFDLFGPNNATCTGPPAFSSTVPTLGSFNYDSANFTPTATGTYRWVARYSGDANNSPVTGACNDANESVSVAAVTPVLTTTAPAGATVGRQIHDAAGLAGGTNPIGTITFALHGPGDSNCAGTPVFLSSVSVAGNTGYRSGNFTPTTAGTYRWVARYSGDVNNTPAITSCADAASTVLVRAPTPTPTPTPPTATRPSGGEALADTGTTVQQQAAAGVWALVIGGLLVLAGSPPRRGRRSGSRDH